MQKDRAEKSRKRLFLEIDEIQALLDLGVLDLKDASYKWVWPEGKEELKTIYSIETTISESQLPTYSFQDLLEKLPKYIDIVPPDSLKYIYTESTRTSEDENGNYMYRHFLEYGFNEDKSFWIGYKYHYFAYESPIYPFPKERSKEEFEIWAWEQGGICNLDWIKAVYDLLIILIKEGLCKFS